MSELTPNLKLFKYNTETDAKQPFSINDCMNANWDKIDASLGSLEICDIGMSLYVDETKGKRRYLNGQIVDRNTNTEAFFTRLQDITTLYPSLLCTEEEWQTAKTMSAFGQVGKFVFNYSGDEVVSVRLPRVVNIQGLFDLQNLGMTVREGLPNIKGEFVSTNRFNNQTSGCFNTEELQSNIYSGGGVGLENLVYFNASLSSSTYQDNAPVQQEAIQYPYFIQIATGSETENNIINEIELNNPYSLFDSKYSDHELNNLSWLKSEGQWNAKAVYPTAYDKLLKVYNGTETVEGLSVKLSTETYTDYDFVLNTSDETFRLPLKTKLASGKAVVGNGLALGLTNGSDYAGLRSGQGTYPFDSPVPSAYGSTVGTQFEGAGALINQVSLGVTSDPTKSGIELSDSGLYLYFYVGETVQNANLIDAGRIGEQVASLIPDNSSLITNYCTPDYSNGIGLAITSNSFRYTCPSNGMITIKLYCTPARNAFVYINGSPALMANSGSGANATQLNGSVLVGKNDIVTISGADSFEEPYSYMYFYPMKGAK